MAAYERANIEVLIHVLPTSVMHLFCDAHSAASTEKFKMTTPATDALLRPRLVADADATAQCTRRENDTNEVCNGIL